MRHTLPGDNYQLYYPIFTVKWGSSRFLICHTLSPDYLVSGNYTILSLQWNEGKTITQIWTDHELTLTFLDQSQQSILQMTLMA
jgi:hypothetical protein